MARKIRVLLLKMMTTFYRRVIVFSRQMENISSPANLPFPIDITTLQEKDLPAYHRFRPEQNPRMIRKRIADGDQCFLVRREGQIVHSGWVATGRKLEPYLRCPLILQPDEIFLYDHYTHPSFRGNGLAQARDICVLRRYREKGYQRSLAVVAVENKRAFRPFEAIGYLPIGMFKCLRFGPWQWTWVERWGEAPLPVSTKRGM
jgi:ribosomal protein S18 acetylase RimI-like enzyme